MPHSAGPHQSRSWRIVAVCRTCRDASWRLGRAYRVLVTRTTQERADAGTTPEPQRRTSHANRNLRTRLDSSTGAGPDH
jgi:hypothetical protein